VDWTLRQCLFMVVITMSTIGYGDWLHLEGNNFVLAEYFTMLLAMIGIAVPAFVISNMTALIVEGVLGDSVRRKRMLRNIEKLSGHFIVCGAGETGEHCILELLKTGRPFVVIDSDAARLQELRQKLGDFLFVLGNAGHDATLMAAHIERAAGLAACLPDDRDNLFVTLSAHVLKPSLRIISRGSDEAVKAKLQIAGASAVVSPSTIGGLRMVSEMVRPATVSFLDGMLRGREGVRFDEMHVAAGSRVAGKSLAEARLRETGDVLVVAARAESVKEFEYNPTATYVLQPGATVIVLGAAEEIAKVRPLFEA
jgi:voltage-gated potassium channel